LEKEGKAGKTIQNYSESLCAFLDWCVKREYLKNDPLKNLGGFDTTPNTRRRALSPEELRRLIAVAPPARTLLYLVASLSGLRKKELSSLKVRDLDLINGGLILDPSWTKNRKSDFQPLPSQLLNQVAESCKGKVSEDHLFKVPSHTARCLDHDLQRAGIPKLTEEGKVDFHAFRNVYASLVVEAGATVKEAQSLLRHSNPTLTMNTYARTRRESLRQVTDRAEELVGNKAECAISVQQAVAGGGGELVNFVPDKGLQQNKDGGGGGSRTRVQRYIGSSVYVHVLRLESYRRELPQAGLTPSQFPEKFAGLFRNRVQPTIP